MKKINVFSLQRVFQKLSIASVALTFLNIVTVITCLILMQRAYEEGRKNIYMLDSSEVYQLTLVKDTAQTRFIEAQAQAVDLMHLLFDLSPDVYQINYSWRRLLELSGDKSLRIFYQSLEESEKFFSRIVTENITQKIIIGPENIAIKAQGHGFAVKAKGTLIITRPSAESEYSIMVDFYLRQGHRSPVNGHGFLVEKMKRTNMTLIKNDKRFFGLF